MEFRRGLFRSRRCSAVSWLGPLSLGEPVVRQGHLADVLELDLHRIARSVLTAPDRLAHHQPSFEQSRRVMPFSFAYLPADSSIIGRTIDWSEAIQSVMVFHFLPSHC